MKILCITHKYPPMTGGMEKQSYELIEGLAQHNEVLRLAYTGGESKLKWILGLKKRIQHILHEHNDIDLIHLNDGLIASVCSWLPRYTRVPVTATVHGLDITFPSAAYRKWVFPKLHTFAGIYAVSDYTRRQCIELGFSADRVHVVANGVDHDLADLPKDESVWQELRNMHGVDLAGKPVVVGLGRAVRRKGFSWFATEVMPKLKTDATFVIVGPHAEREAWWQRLLPARARHKVELLLGTPSDSADVRRAAMASDRVVQAGKLPFPMLMSLLAQADVFVMPNLDIPGDAEGFGLVALEASLRGCPVLAADLEGITTAIHHGHNGLLLPSGDSTAWASSLEELLTQADKRRQLGINGKAYTLAHFGWNKMVNEYEAAFRKLIKA